MNEQLKKLAVSIANDLAAIGREDILKEALNLLKGDEESLRVARVRLAAEINRSQAEFGRIANVRLRSVKFLHLIGANRRSPDLDSRLFGNDAAHLPTDDWLVAQEEARLRLRAEINRSKAEFGQPS